jgi:hypothetical protein
MRLVDKPDVAVHALARRATRARRHLRIHVRRWFDKLLAHWGVPSAVPVVDREKGAVVWFGVEYQLRSSQGDIPGGVTPVAPVIVYKRLSHEEIGRIVAEAGSIRLAFGSSSGVDKRALRIVAECWFDGATFVGDVE